MTLGELIDACDSAEAAYRAAMRHADHAGEIARKAIAHSDAKSRARYQADAEHALDEARSAAERAR